MAFSSVKIHFQNKLNEISSMNAKEKSEELLQNIPLVQCSVEKTMSQNYFNHAKSYLQKCINFSCSGVG